MKINVSISRGTGTVLEEVIVELAAVPRRDEVVRIPPNRYLIVTEVHHLANVSAAAAAAVVICKEV